jgi:sugar phosphate isomerase/epimerase
MLHVKLKNNFKLCLDLYLIRDANCIGYCCSKPENLLNKFSIASEAGFDFIEVWHKDIMAFVDLYGVEPIVEKLKSLNLKISSLKVLNDWFLGDNSLDIIYLAEKIKAEIIVVKLVPDEYKGRPIELDYCLSRYNDLLKICDDINVKPAIEFMALAKCMNKIDDVYKIMQYSSGKNKSLVLDTWHLWRNDDSKFTKFLNSVNNLNISWAGIVHFTDADRDIPRLNQKDGDRRLPTQGCLDLSSFCDKINNMGFSGYYSLNVYDRNLWNEDNLKTAVLGRYLMRQSIDDYKDIKDSVHHSNKQQHRCDGLWAKSYRTHLDPRFKKTNRDDILNKKLENYLQGNYVLDFKCGFSPLVNFVSEGFDASTECIGYLKRKYPDKKWHISSDSDFSENYKKTIDVLLHIGLGDSDTEEKSHMTIRKNCKPKLVIIECASDKNNEVDESKEGNRARWERLKGGLEIIEEFNYKTNMAERSFRKMIIGKLN